MPFTSKTIRHVFLTEQAYGMMARLAATRGENETGGPMVGYMTVDHALVVTAAGGPGPNGKCLPASVTIDGAYATAFCAAETARSQGAVVYVGDWHVHNGEDANPSPKDRIALRKLPPLNAWGYPIVSLVLNDALDHYACIHRRGAVECSILDR